MSEQSAFHKKSMDAAAAPLQERGLLEEMNLPPKVIAFIRENSRVLQIVAVVVAVAVVGWSLADSYLDRKKDQAAFAMYEAMNSDQASRQQALETVRSSSSGAVELWSTVELAHIDFANGDFDAARKKYEEALSRDGEGFLKPLLLLSIARCLEQMGDSQGAVNKYKEVADIQGFEQQVYPAMGRLYASLGDTAKARAAYEQYLIVAKANGAGADEVAFIEDHLGRLTAAAE